MRFRRFAGPTLSERDRARSSSRETDSERDRERSWACFEPGGCVCDASDIGDGREDDWAELETAAADPDNFSRLCRCRGDDGGDGEDMNESETSEKAESWKTFERKSAHSSGSFGLNLWEEIAVSNLLM